MYISTKKSIINTFLILISTFMTACGPSDEDIYREILSHHPKYDFFVDRDNHLIQEDIDFNKPNLFAVMLASDEASDFFYITFHALGESVPVEYIKIFAADGYEFNSKVVKMVSGKARDNYVVTGFAMPIKRSEWQKLDNKTLTLYLFDKSDNEVGDGFFIFPHYIEKRVIDGVTRLVTIMRRNPQDHKVKSTNHDENHGRSRRRN